MFDKRETTKTSGKIKGKINPDEPSGHSYQAKKIIPIKNIIIGKSSKIQLITETKWNCDFL